MIVVVAVARLLMLEFEMQLQKSMEQFLMPSEGVIIILLSQPGANADLVERLLLVVASWSCFNFRSKKVVRHRQSTILIPIVRLSQRRPLSPPAELLLAVLCSMFFSASSPFSLLLLCFYVAAINTKQHDEAVRVGNAMTLGLKRLRTQCVSVSDRASALRNLASI